MGRKVNDLVGLRVGKLVVVAIDPLSESGSGKNKRWLCLCDCGETKSALSGNLTRGVPASCGCSKARPRWKYLTDGDAKKAAADRAFAWNKANPDRYKLAARKHYENNKSVAFERAYFYSKLKKLRRCTCCTDQELNEFYKGRPFGDHVDHVYPLSKGGLHCLSNLQYLPAIENLRKGNRVLI